VIVDGFVDHHAPRVALDQGNELGVGYRSQNTV